jgi:endonuclease YncB( thermonuclease family)
MREASPWFLAAVLGFILCTSPCQGQDPQRSPTLATPSISRTSKVLRVVDGDTVILLLDGKQVRVRLIGIDTPETVDPRKLVEE